MEKHDESSGHNGSKEDKVPPRVRYVRSAGKIWKFIVGGSGLIAVVGVYIAAAAPGHWFPFEPHPSPGPTASSPSSTPSTSSPAPKPSLLVPALLPASVIGTGMTEVGNPITDVSKITEICGAKLPPGARSTASEMVEDPQKTTIFYEEIVDWSDSSDAAKFVTDEGDMLNQSQCEYSNEGTDQQFDGTPSPAATPPGCGSGQTLATGVSITGEGGRYWGGDYVGAQCGTYTISITLTHSVDSQNTGTASGYLTHAVDQLMSVT